MLRFWSPEDAPAMLDAVNADRASLLPWLPWARNNNRTVEECLASINRMRTDRERIEPTPNDFTIAIFERSSGLPMGGTSLHRIAHAWHEAEIGYFIRGDRRREGLCAEAVSGLISRAFTPQDRGGWGLRRIHIRCAGRNIASQCVPRKLGLREEARLVRERWVDTIGWDDTLVWGVCADEWRAGR
jgi:RimJ/RimL family protein N-acetyltransferase